MSTPVYRNFFSMGTRLDILFPDADEEIADGICRLLSSELERIEAKISIYRENSTFSMINREAYAKPVYVDEQILSLIDELIDLSGKTQGYFDFTLGKFKSLKLSEIEPLSANKNDFIKPDGKGYLSIKTDMAEKTISFGNDYLALDSGGFGKGLGLDIFKNILKGSEIKSGFISFGESSVFAHGHHPYGDKWKTGIRNMFIENENVFIFELRDEFLSVSGITPMNVGKYGSGHVINPFTGHAVNKYINSAVAGKKGLDTEIISTALLVAPAGIRDRIMDNFPGYLAVVIEYDEVNRPYIVYSRTN